LAVVLLKHFDLLHCFHL